MIDSIHAVLGEWDQSHSMLHIQRPQVSVLDPETKRPIETIVSNVPDLLSVHGSLQPSPNVAQGALLSARFQRGPPFKGCPSLTWEINCEAGSVRVVSRDSTVIGAGVDHGTISVQLHDFKSGEVEDVEFPWDSSVAGLGLFARNMASVYEAFALGREGSYASFEDAVFRHKEVDGMIARFAEGQQ